MFITEVRMIKGWKIFSFLIVVAVCLGLMLVPGAPPQVGLAQPTPNSGIEVVPNMTTVGFTEDFDLEIWARVPVNQSWDTADAHLDFNPTYMQVNAITDGVLPTVLLSTWNNATGTIDYTAGSLMAPVTGDKLVCTINCTSKSTNGVSAIDFVDIGPLRITNIIYSGSSLIDWNLVVNGTLVVGDVFNLTVTSDGCCPITVGTLGTVAANSTDSFIVPCPSVTLTADESDVCCVFDNWTVDGNTTGSNPVIVTGAANSTHNATADCSVPLDNLTMAVTGSGNTSPAIGSHSYPCGEVVNVSATADPGWWFVNWTGDLTGSTNPTTITIDGDKNVTANFVERFTLTMAVNGNGTTDPAPGNWTVLNGTGVAINATPDTGWHFVNWTTADMSEIANATAALTSVTVDKNKTVTANFAINEYNLTINSTAGGNVTTPGEGVQGPYNHGTEVNLTATPDTNYTFVNWTGDVGTIGDVNSTTTNITMNGNYSITANFAIKQYNLIINSTTGGDVTTPGEATFGPYDHGDVQNLIAEADADYAFLEWSGNVSEIDDVNSTNTNITMYGNYSIMALFGPHDFDATPRSLTFTTVEGENPPSQTLEICNTGNGTLDWSVSDNKGWLKESPTSGSLAEEGCEDVKVSVDVAGMRAGDYRATITFTGSPTLEVPVSLHIESAMIEIPGGPAGLSASALSISPQQVQPDQDVTISINVANTGGKTGSYNAVLYINSVVEDSQTVSVAAGASKNVIFTVSKSQAGVYDVSLAGQSGQFEVVGGGGWFGGGGLGTGGIIAIVVVVIILIVAVIFILRGTTRPE